MTTATTPSTLEELKQRAGRGGRTCEQRIDAAELRRIEPDYENEADRQAAREANR